MWPSISSAERRGSDFTLVDMNFSTPHYPLISRALRPAGLLLERLINRPTARTLAAARTLARRIEAAVADSPEPLGEAIIFYGQSTFTTAGRPDYRGLALAFASDLRMTISNARAHRPLTQGLPHRPDPLRFIVVYNPDGVPIQITRTDGRGHSVVTPLSAPPPSPMPHLVDGRI